jgi:hypothetical protein
MRCNFAKWCGCAHTDRKISAARISERWQNYFLLEVASICAQKDLNYPRGGRKKTPFVAARAPPHSTAVRLYTDRPLFA